MSANNPTSEIVTYALPPEPDGPVWDEDGNKWERDGDYWKSETYGDHEWHDLLHSGTLTNTEPAPDWPTAPLVWYGGEAWTRLSDGSYTARYISWAEEGLQSTFQHVRDVSARFAREAVPVTLVPTEAWEKWKSWVPSEAVGASADDVELVNAADSLAQEVAR